MRSEAFETIIGAVVVVVTAAFLIFVYTSTDRGAVSGYELVAKFNKADGVKRGSDVRMSGIKIGTVRDLSLDPQSYFAVVKMSISDDVEVPEDSSVKIASESLLGGNYLSIEPGGSLEVLASGDEILYAQGSVDLMSLRG